VGAGEIVVKGPALDLNAPLAGPEVTDKDKAAFVFKP